MIIRNCAFAIVTLAAIAPAISNASNEKASAQACATAFASNISASGTDARAYKFTYRSGTAITLADFYPSDYSFTLEAREPKTGSIIARARCTTDHRSVVTAIAAIPLTSGTRLAAAF